MPARASISTTTYSKAFLSIIWQMRHQLKETERRGFAEFMYLTASAHLEGVLSEMLRWRCYHLRSMVHWEKLAPIKYTKDGQEQYCDIKPLYESLLRIVEDWENKTCDAPLNKLILHYNVTFNPKIQCVIGKELYDDLLALADLRNMFAHGRDFVIEFENPFDHSSYASLSSNRIQKPATRLYKAGIIKDLKITQSKYAEFQSAFFSDDALLYFYRAVEQIEQKLYEGVSFLPEKDIRTVPTLPKLE